MVVSENTSSSHYITYDLRKRNGSRFEIKNRSFEQFLCGGLSLYFFKNNALAERGVKLRNLDFAFDGLLIFTRPDNVIRLRRLEPE